MHLSQKQKAEQDDSQRCRQLGTFLRRRSGRRHRRRRHGKKPLRARGVEEQTAAPGRGEAGGVQDSVQGSRVEARQRRDLEIQRQSEAKRRRAVAGALGGGTRAAVAAGGGSTGEARAGCGGSEAAGHRCRGQEAGASPENVRGVHAKSKDIEVALQLVARIRRAVR